jgi:threonine/homoserine/homoserine lactone efflux protein
MFEFQTLLLFLLAAIVAGLTPGPVFVYIVARSLQGGTAYGVMSALGAFVGGFAHVAAATVGLSALLMQSALAFSILKYLGAAYLVYLGIRILLEPNHDQEARLGQPLTKLAVLRQTILTELFNPKTALFFLAFVPQFVKPEAGGVALQFFVYGLIANVVFTLVEIAVAVFAGTLGAVFLGRPRWRKGRKVASGVTLIALGGAAALADARTK